jgi:rhodanese-related sulfurtransferase
LVLVAVAVIGQPTTADRWERIAPEKETVLANRAVQIDPGELLSLTGDDRIKLIMLDVRSESDYNLFHLLDSEHVPLTEIPDIVSKLHLEPANTVVVTISNDEADATTVWKTLVAESVPNVYILGGGINGWLKEFSEVDPGMVALVSQTQNDRLAYSFDMAYGSRHPAAAPNPAHYALVFESKVKLETKRAAASGGCG